MEEEKRTEETKTEETKTVVTGEEENKEGSAPVITKSMTEGACPTCDAEAPTMPEVLPDPTWSTEKLIEAVKDKHMLVRSNAIVLLAKRAPSESLEALIEALKDEEYLVKSNAMVAIAAYGRQVSDRMIQALDDADQDVRAGAAWVVGELKDQRAIEALEKVAKDSYPLARIQAKASLITLGKRPVKETKMETEEEAANGAAEGAKEGSAEEIQK
jgi:HEAT repeat protein